mgnify:CR=1 FL=1
MKNKKYYIHKIAGMCRSKLIRDSKNISRYVDKNGVLVKNTWITYKEKKYYFDKNGHALKGMKKVGKNYYYFQAKYGYMMRHVRYMNSRNDVYYFGGDGVMVKMYSIHGAETMKAIPIILAPMERCREAGSNWTERDIILIRKQESCTKTVQLRKTERAIHLMKMVYTQLYPQQIRKNKKCRSERKAAGIFMFIRYKQGFPG